MDKEKLKSQFGYNDKAFSDLCKEYPKIPKGTFQIKKRGERYYWYYTLSIKIDNRVKYLSKAYNVILKNLIFRNMIGK